MPTSLRFAIVPKVAHPWFDEVHKGARQQAELLSARLGFSIVIDYLPPGNADTAEQNAMLERAAQSRPDGIALDPLDAIGNIAAINHIRGLGIPLVVFDSPSPDPSITSVGNDFAQQGTIAAERLTDRRACEQHRKRDTVDSRREQGQTAPRDRQLTRCSLNVRLHAGGQPTCHEGAAVVTELRTLTHDGTRADPARLTR